MKLIKFDLKLIARMSLEFSNSLPLIANSLRAILRNELDAQVVGNIYTYNIYIYLLHHSRTPTRARVKHAYTRARVRASAISLRIPLITTIGTLPVIHLTSSKRRHNDYQNIML